MIATFLKQQDIHSKIANHLKIQHQYIFNFGVYIKRPLSLHMKEIETSKGSGQYPTPEHLTAL